MADITAEQVRQELQALPKLLEDIKFAGAEGGWEVDDARKRSMEFLRKYGGGLLLLAAQLEADQQRIAELERLLDANVNQIETLDTELSAVADATEWPPKPGMKVGHIERLVHDLRERAERAEQQLIGLREKAGALCVKWRLDAAALNRLILYDCADQLLSLLPVRDGETR